ncbi:hypothetical protein BC835DRAFT_1308261 [Cytidiella melzeri]|nr:hypothetical protein BC835DRAFT_1308261 [Cytidiella melzeri]
MSHSTARTSTQRTQDRSRSPSQLTEDNRQPRQPNSSKQWRTISPLWMCANEEEYWQRFLHSQRGWVGPEELKDIRSAGGCHHLRSRSRRRSSSWLQGNRNLGCIVKLEQTIADQEATIANLEKEIKRLRAQGGSSGATHPLESWISMSRAEGLARPQSEGVATPLEDRISIPPQTNAGVMASGYDTPSDDEYGFSNPEAECKALQRKMLAEGRCWITRSESRSLHPESPSPDGRGKGKAQEAARPLQEQLGEWQASGWPTATTSMGPASFSEHPAPVLAGLGPQAMASPEQYYPATVMNNYLPERDAQGNVIPLMTSFPGKFCIVYEVVIDLSLPFPPRPPAPSAWSGMNPITGSRVLVLTHHEVVRSMDLSRLHMAEFAIPGAVTRIPWRRPTTADELALQFFGELVASANKKKSAFRSVVEHELSSAAPRPLWASYRAPKGRAHRERHSVRRNPVPTPEPTMAAMEVKGVQEAVLPQGLTTGNPENSVMEDGEVRGVAGDSGEGEKSPARF